MAVTNAGLLAWCDTIRFAMAKDPGRELFETQIQQHGFDFLDSYLDDVLSRQETDHVYDLMKTPGKKKDSQKRTRPATTAAAKSKATTSTIFEERESEHENIVPVNDFQRALMAAKDDDTIQLMEPVQFLKKARTQTATVAEDGENIPPPVHRVSPPEQMTPPPVNPTTTYETTVEHIPVRQPSPPPESPSPSLAAEIAATEPTNEEPSTLVLDLLPEETAHDEPIKELSIIAEDDEVAEQDNLEVQEATTSVPFPSASDHNMDLDMTVPIREDGSDSSMKRKATLSMTNLPAPSPLRKSMRMSREPSAALNLLMAPVQTPGAPLGGKRTSWLTKAKEAKALEMTGSGKRAGRLAGSAEPTNSSSNLDSLALGSANSLKNIFKVGSSNASEALPSLHSNTILDDNDTIMSVEQPAEPSTKARDLSAPPGDDVTGRIGATIHQRTEAQSGPAAGRSPPSFQPTPYHSLEDMTVPMNDDIAEAASLDLLKKTVGDVGARTTRSFSKSLGGNAAAALAEARKAAEARVAQRNKDENGDVSVMEVEAPNSTTVNTPVPETTVVVESTQRSETRTSPAVTSEADRRLSLSELVSASQQKASSSAVPVPEATITNTQDVDMSISTTPPNSPPVIVKKPIKPPLEFKPFATPLGAAVPSSSQELAPKELPEAIKNFTFKLPSTNPFSLPVPASLVANPAPNSSVSSHKPAPAVSAQTSKASIFSDSVFDKAHSLRAWEPATQDTIYATAHSRPQQGQNNDLDDDDSWHIDDKFQRNEAWTPYGFVNTDKEDVTWSTIPSRDGSDTHGFTEALQQAALEHAQHKPTDQEVTGAFDFDPDLDKARVEINEADLDVDMDIEQEPHYGGELDDIIASDKPTIRLVTQTEPPRSQSQLSTASASTTSSQGNAGFFGQATRFMTSVLGATKQKGKLEPPKSLARAAAIAKKQQDEADKKAARLKDMENRRQLAIQRKAEEEKARAEEEERKIREENEKRKREREREREEHTGKLPVVKPPKKVEDDVTGKRKIAAEPQKKPESKKPPSKDAQSRSIKPPSASLNAPGTATKGGAVLKSTLSKQPSANSVNAASSIPKAPAHDTASSKPGVGNLKAGPSKGKAKASERDDAQPSQVVQSQMADRAKAQVQTAQTPRQPPPVTSESIELPDINSEYSDSEDEDRPRSFDPPGWAQSPALRTQLEQQSRMNPDDIFGRIGPLRMEEIFRTRQSRFRARTSSANWSGVDQLTEQEEREYARRMGFTR